MCSRLPFKGEFLLIIEDSEQDPHNDNDSANINEVITEQKNDILKILFVILIIIVLVYFLFYRKYLKLTLSD